MNDDGSPTPDPDDLLCTTEDGSVAIDPVTGVPMTQPSNEWLNAHALWPYSAGVFAIDTWYETYQDASALVADPDTIPDAFGTKPMLGLRFRVLSPEGPRQHVMLLPVDRAKNFAALIVQMAETAGG